MSILIHSGLEKKCTSQIAETSDLARKRAPPSPTPIYTPIFRLQGLKNSRMVHVSGALGDGSGFVSRQPIAAC